MADVIIFSDLDGCLLNKEDYRFDAALPVLERIFESEIPLILASSKTIAEMRVLAAEMQLRDAPLICENGGAVFWSREPDAECEVLGAKRSDILAGLAKLHAEYEFESFQDMGLQGVMKATDLPEDRARLALDRSSTEPLLWRDEETKITDFANHLATLGLTLTKGGRFWHVAGETSKGAGMARVLAAFNEGRTHPYVSLAIGDSPIDQSMLDIAQYPIGIPSPDGVVQVQVKAQNGLLASVSGAAGWAAAVAQILNQLGV